MGIPIMEYDSRRDHSGHFSVYIGHTGCVPYLDYVGEADTVSDGISLSYHHRSRLGDKVYVMRHATIESDIDSLSKDLAFYGEFSKGFLCRKAVRAVKDMSYRFPN